MKEEDEGGGIPKLTALLALCASVTFDALYFFSGSWLFIASVLSSAILLPSFVI